MGRTFYITEVFSEQPYGGNQLATVLDAGDIPVEEMQQIARAFNFSETTFFTGGNEAEGFDVRIFTPTEELPFAGHPTLGSAYLARQLYCQGDAGLIRLNLGVGQIPVTFTNDDVLWMRQKAPVFGPAVQPDKVATSLGLSVTDIAQTYPCQYVSTGLEFLLVPLVSLDGLRKIKVQSDEFGHGLLAFCPQGYNADQQIGARMFAASLDVTEDPATGSANGCLAAYLVEHKYFGSTRVDVRVGQGYEIGRPSQLYLRASKSDTEYEINVGGKVRIVAEGGWKI